MGVGFRATSGPVIAKSGDLAALLTNLEDGDVLFIDEIHRLQPRGRGGALSGDGGSRARSDDRRRSVRPLASASICRASPWSAPPPARDCSPRRCAIASAFRSGCNSIRSRSWKASSAARRGLLDLRAHPGRRARDRPPLARHAAHRRAPAAPRARFRPCRRAPRRSTRKVAGRRAQPARGRCARPRRDGPPLSDDDRRHLSAAAPSGIETLAAGLSEPRDTIEEVIEPYLIQLGLIARTARGALPQRARVDASRPQPSGGRSGRAVRRLKRGPSRPPFAARGVIAIEPQPGSPAALMRCLHRIPG